MLRIDSAAIRFGPGCLDQLGAEVARLGYRRILVIGDEGVAAPGPLAAAEASLRAAGLEWQRLLAAAAEPTDAGIRALREQVGAPPEAIVAVGGGSTLDQAKCLALGLGAGDDLIQYLNPPFGAGLLPERPPLPLVAVPTTAGSGSDVSPVAVLQLVATGVKTAIRLDELRPVLVIADPETTVTLPRTATAAAGLDALSHAIEAMLARRADDPPEPSSGRRYSGASLYTDLLAEAAVEPLARWLPRAIENGRDLEARVQVMQAATLANLGAALAGAHLGHACAYAIAERLSNAAQPRSVPHGLLTAILAPAVVLACAEADPEASIRISVRLAAAGWEPEQGEPRPEAVPEQMRALLGACGAPVSLASIGLESADLEAMAASAREQRALTAGAPIGFDQNGGIECILSAALK